LTTAISNAGDVFSFFSHDLPSFSVCFFFYCSGAHLDLHSFPTRRSSDLPRRPTPPCTRRIPSPPRDAGAPGHPRQPRAPGCLRRSEEHTSELQSRENLVCRLLLEKKKSPNSPMTSVSSTSEYIPARLNYS